MNPDPLSFDRPAAYYDRYWSEEGFNPEQMLSASLCSLLERSVRPSYDSIDVGCGEGGGASRWLNTHTASYVGVDVSNRAVEAARNAGLNAVTIEDASRLPYGEASFDVAICFEVCEHLLDPHLAVSEILRVLRPEGLLIVTVPNVAHWRRRLDLALLGRWNPQGDDQSTTRPWRDPHLRFFARTNLRDMLAESGLEPLEIAALTGPFLADVPGLRRLTRRDAASPVYAWLTQVAPALFGRRLYAIARKPEA